MMMLKSCIKWGEWWMFAQDNDPERGWMFQKVALHIVISQNTPRALAWIRPRQWFRKVNYSMKYLLTIRLPVETVTAQTWLHDLFLYQNKFMHDILDGNTTLNLILDSVARYPFYNYDFTSQLLLCWFGGRKVQAYFWLEFKKQIQKDNLHHWVREISANCSMKIN